MTVARWMAVQVDCADPVSLAEFWAQVVGGTVDEVLGDPPLYVAIRPAAEGGTWLSFQRGPEPKVVKNRLHLDLWPDDLDAATERIEAMGGSRTSDEVAEEFGFRWRVMADPEGNGFCLVVPASGSVP
jgi:predicted enzyme related to lactoylglutathione lyase